jgi:hypothetical protein
VLPVAFKRGRPHPDKAPHIRSPDNLMPDMQTGAFDPRAGGNSGSVMDAGFSSTAEGIDEATTLLFCVVQTILKTRVDLQGESGESKGIQAFIPIS